MRHEIFLIALLALLSPAGNCAPSHSPPPGKASETNSSHSIEASSSEGPDWSQVEPFQIPVLKGDKTVSCEIRSLLRNGKLKLQIKLPSETPLVRHRQWVWDAANQFYISGDEEESALYIFLFTDDKSDFVADLWIWRSARNASSGYADDYFCRILRGNDGTKIINCHPDTGVLPWFGRHHANFAGEKIPRFSQRMAEGSAGDVKAKSLWTDGNWTIELERELDTSNADDIPFHEKSFLKAAVFANLRVSYPIEDWEKSQFTIKLSSEDLKR